MTVHRRTFEAKNHPKGSDERKRLNEDPVTSEYMPSYRYAAIGDNYRLSFRSKKEAMEFEAVREGEPEDAQTRPPGGIGAWDREPSC